MALQTWKAALFFVGDVLPFGRMANTDETPPVGKRHTPQVEIRLDPASPEAQERVTKGESWQYGFVDGMHREQSKDEPLTPSELEIYDATRRTQQAEQRAKHKAEQSRLHNITLHIDTNDPLARGQAKWLLEMASLAGLNVWGDIGEDKDLTLDEVEAYDQAARMEPCEKTPGVDDGRDMSYVPIEEDEGVKACKLDTSESARFEVEVRAETDALARMLVQKNQAYGDAALNPLRCFSRASPIEQILVRIDDKLSRLSRGSAAGEDVVKDLQGYLVLLRIAQRRKGEPEESPASSVVVTGVDLGRKGSSDQTVKSTVQVEPKSSDPDPIEGYPKGRRWPLYARDCKEAECVNLVAGGVDGPHDVCEYHLEEQAEARQEEERQEVTELTGALRRLHNACGSHDCGASSAGSPTSFEAQAMKQAAQVLGDKS